MLLLLQFFFFVCSPAECFECNRFVLDAVSSAGVTYVLEKKEHDVSSANVRQYHGGADHRRNECKRRSVSEIASYADDVTDLSDLET